MINPKAFIFITALLICISTKLTAQKRLVLGKVSYIIPHFKQDSVMSFDDWFVQNKIVSSIKASPNPLEIRFWYKPWFMTQPDEGEYIIIKGNKNSISADIYSLKSRFQPPHNKQGTIFRKYAPNFNLDIIFKQYHVPPSQKLDSIVKVLLSNGVTDQPDDKKLMDSLNRNNVKLIENDVTDCCTTFNYEMKVHNTYRNFTVFPLYYTKENDAIKEIHRGHQLLNVLFKFDYLIVYGVNIHTD